MTPRLRDCGNPACAICRYNRDGYRDSGHVEEESLVRAVLGAAAIVLIAIVAFVLLPVLAS